MPRTHGHRNLISRTRAATLVATVALVGCGGSETVMNTEPLTEEQKAAIRSEDLLVESEERGTPTSPPAKKR